VTAFEWTQTELLCDAPGCYERFTGERGLRPTSGETRAALRKRAAGEGWTFVRSKLGRRYDGRDFCPEHKPEDAAKAVGEGNGNG
jgi:hypothetical protein